MNIQRRKYNGSKGDMDHRHRANDEDGHLRESSAVHLMCPSICSLQVFLIGHNLRNYHSVRTKRFEIIQFTLLSANRSLQF
jgi:hypothetical protein